MKTSLFNLYRYQILPVSSQFNLLYDINETIKRKNEYFSTALQNLNVIAKTSRNAIKIELQRCEDDLFLFIASKVKNVKYYDERHTTKRIPSHPYVRIICYNDKKYQYIAIERNYECQLGSRFVANLEKNLTRFLKDNNLIVKIAPVHERASFWTFINDHHDSINRVHFSLITPNMSNISSCLSEDMKRTAKNVQASTTDYILHAEKGKSLRVSEQDKDIQGLEDYASKGGGEVTVHARNVRKVYKSGEHQMCLEIEDLDVTGSPDAIIRMMKELENGNNR